MLSTPVEVMEGEPFVLNVSASASPSKLDYTWEKDGQQRIGSHSDSDEICFSGGFLHLARVSRDHAGTYTCTGGGHRDTLTVTVQCEY